MVIAIFGNELLHMIGNLQGFIRNDKEVCKGSKFTNNDNIMALFAILAVFVCMLAIAGISNMTITGDLNMAFADTSSHRQLYQWGSYGIGQDGKFVHPQFITVDENTGEVYVTDLGNKRVQKFDSNGAFLASWGRSGHADGLFNYPSGIATDGSFVYVADRDLNRIQKFDLNGSYISQWGERGKIKGSLSMPNGVAASDDGHIYVVDTGNYRVQKFTAEGEFVLSFGSSGLEYGKFVTPHDIDIDDNDGTLYVSDRGNKRIDHYMPNGTYIKSYEFEAYPPFEFVPESIVLANGSMIYATNAYSQDVLYLNLSESSRSLVGSEKIGPFYTARMVFPTDTALGIDGQLYVIDSLDHTIYAYETPQYVSPPPLPAESQAQAVAESPDDQSHPDRQNNINEEKQHPVYYDTTPPVITAPPDITVDATGMWTLVDVGMPNATDDYQISAILTNAPEKFPVGTSKITWIAFDEAKNTSEAYQYVTVLACGLQSSAYNVFYGTGTNDVIDGTTGADLIFGQAGRDVIRGGAGNDCIFGEEGDDVIEGGPDSDYIVGGVGNDILRGGGGADIIYGGAGADFLDGGADSVDKCEQDDGLDLSADCESFITN